jgi:hypothetical protein
MRPFEEEASMRLSSRLSVLLTASVTSLAACSPGLTATDPEALAAECLDAEVAPRSPDAARCSEALFNTAEPLFQRYLAFAVPAGTADEQKAAIERKTALMNQLTRTYERTLDLGIPAWQAAAAYRLGQLSLAMADTLRNAPLPTDLSNEAGIAEGYQAGIDAFAAALDAHAISLWKGFLISPAAADPNDWVRRIQADLTAIEAGSADVDY